MNTRKMISRLTENWVAKVICVAAAILVYVFHQVAVLDHKTLTVPLEVVSEGLLVNETDVPSFVKVNVRCSADSIGAITAQGISAVLNLNHYTEVGDYDVPVTISVSKDLMLIDPLEVSVKPDYVSLTLDEKVEKYVSVKPSVSGEVSHGYFVKSVEIVPSTVKIIGPSKIVEKTNFIYSDKVNVKGASTGFSTEVGLDNINALVSAKVEEPFRVNVTIAPSPSDLVFTGVTPKLISLDGNLENSSTIPPLNFTLTGTVPMMEKFNLSEQSVVIDCSSIKSEGSYELPVLFVLPVNISVKEKSYETVSLMISEKSSANAEENPSVNQETSSDSGVSSGEEAVEEKKSSKRRRR